MDNALQIDLQGELQEELQGASRGLQAGLLGGLEGLEGASREASREASRVFKGRLLANRRRFSAGSKASLSCLLSASLANRTLIRAGFKA